MASLSPVRFAKPNSQAFIPSSFALEHPQQLQEELWPRHEHRPTALSSFPELNPLCHLPGLGDFAGGGGDQHLLPAFSAHDLDLVDCPFGNSALQTMEMMIPDDSSSSLKEIVCKLPCIASLVGSSPTPASMPMSMAIPVAHHQQDLRPNMNSNMWAPANASQRNGMIHLPASSLHCPPNFGVDPGFVERAVKFSSYGNRPTIYLDQKGCSTPIINSPAQMMLAEPLPHPSPREQGTLMGEVINERSGGSTTCSPRLRANNDCTSASDHPAQEASSNCDQGGAVAALQKTVEKKKRGPLKIDDAKGLDVDESIVKRVKCGDGAIIEDDKKRKLQHSTAVSGNSNDSSQKTVNGSSKLAGMEAPSKPDYVHVRARRGQATDSHSLAERVRREKISERMKYLQDLVPGCSKITGKAVMLDEIINYVQSLQRQVEFLSMKLAAVHPTPGWISAWRALEE